MNKNNLDESFKERGLASADNPQSVEESPFGQRQDPGLITGDAGSTPAESTDLPETASNRDASDVDARNLECEPSHRPDEDRNKTDGRELPTDTRVSEISGLQEPRPGESPSTVSSATAVAQISVNEERVFHSSGDLGDALAMCAVIKHLGGGRLLLGNRPWTKQITGERFNYIAPLLRLQPYLTSVEEHEGDLPSNCIDFSHFRQKWQEAKTLVGMHCVYAGLHESAVDPRIPWLTIPEYARHGKIVIACSSRYQGALHYFRIVRAKALDCLFIGLPDEYEQFCWNQGAPNQRNKVGVRYQPVRDAVEAAQVIMGSRLYVGNPTSSTWIAIGCGHPNMLLDCSQRDTDIERAGVRNVRSVGDNPKMHEWAGL